MGRYIDLTGQKFNWLTVIKRAVGAPGRKFLCQCKCGKTVLVRGDHLRSGNTKSCGCRRVIAASELMTTHGHSHTGTYKSWANMLARCRNPELYPRYAGVTVCKRWYDFTKFLADMGTRPKGMSIGRINGHMGYSPNNCRWETPHEQMMNPLTRARNSVAHKDKKLAPEHAAAAAAGHRGLKYKRARGAA